MTVEAPLLELKHLSIGLPGRSGPINLVNDVSFSIMRGEMFGLVGESGSGKSTVALALMGLLAPNARVRGGQIMLRDRKIECSDSAALAGLRLVGLNPPGL